MASNKGQQGKISRITAQGYADAGASVTKRALRDMEAWSGSPARDINDNLSVIRQRARMLYMSAPIATSAIRTLRTNTIGTGLVPKPRPDKVILGMTDEEVIEWVRTVEHEFALWANDKRACDATGTNTFYEMQQLAMQSAKTSGDVIALIKHAKPTKMRPYSLRLYLVEADRVSTPDGMVYSFPGANTTGENTANGNKIYDGVEVNNFGQIVAYHIRNNYPNEWDDAVLKWTRVEAYGRKTGLPNVLHIMEAERPDQYRGVSLLAQVIEPMQQLKRYTAAELTAAVVQSFFTAYIRVQGADENPLNEVGGGGFDDDEEEISHDENEYEMGPGQVNFLEPGEDVVFADPSRPSSGFQSFVEAVTQQIGAALEIPVDLLLKQFNSSYSASRAAFMEAWKTFKMQRFWFVQDFCAPLWEIWMSEAVARGRIQAVGFFDDPLIHAAYLGCEWVGPSQGQLDPTKEIDAEIKAIGHGLTTHEAATVRLNGGDWEANVSRLARENEIMNQSGLVQTTAEAPIETERYQEGSLNDAKQESMAEQPQTSGEDGQTDLRSV